MESPHRQAVIYTRISQDRVGAGLGVKRQQDDCEQLARQLGWPVVAVYSDNDVSAWSGKPRPGYQALLDALSTGRANAVLVWHTDRLHRSTLELEEFISICQRHNVVTQTVKAGLLDLSTPSGQMTAKIVGSVAQYESAHKSERIVRKHQQNAELGKWRGGTRPFGFKSDGISHEPSEVREIRSLASKVLAGSSLGSLIRDLNSRGVKTTTGREWSYATLRQMLLRPRNIGKSVYRGEVVGDGLWEPVLSEDEFRYLHRILRDPSRRSASSNRAKHLMTSLARCGVCGGPLRSAMVHNRDRTKRLIYRCSCGVYRTASLVDSFATGITLMILMRDENRRLLVSDHSEENSRLESQIEDLTKELDELTDAYNQRDITLPQFRSASRRLQDEIGTLEASLQTNGREHIIGDLVGKKDVIERWMKLPLARRRAVIDSLMVLSVPRLGRSAPRDAGRWMYRVELRSGLEGLLEPQSFGQGDIADFLVRIFRSPNLDAGQMNELRRVLNP